MEYQDESQIQELQLGGDAVIRTSNPAGVRRVELTLPQGAFTEQQLLNQELRVASRYPEGRTGNIDASIVTAGIFPKIFLGIYVMSQIFSKLT